MKNKICKYIYFNQNSLLELHEHKFDFVHVYRKEIEVDPLLTKNICLYLIIKVNLFHPFRLMLSEGYKRDQYQGASK